MTLLKDLLHQKIKSKNYYRNNKTGRYLVVRNGIYYTTCNTEDEAKKITKKLEETNWDRTKVPMIKEEIGVINYNKKNKTGFLNTYIEPHSNVKKGYRYVYNYKENGKTIRICSSSLKQLRKMVEAKNLKWKPLTDDAKKINEIIKE